MNTTPWYYPCAEPTCGAPRLHPCATGCPSAAAHDRDLIEDDLEDADEWAEPPMTGALRWGGAR